MEKSKEVIAYLGRVAKGVFCVFIRTIFWVIVVSIIIAILIFFGVYLNDTFGEDYIFIPIVLGVLILAISTLYQSTKNSLKGKKDFVVVVKTMFRNIKEGVIAFLKGGYKLTKWALIISVAIILIWALGSFVASLSAITIIIILLVLILLK